MSNAGLPDAEWWVTGPAVDRAEDADVEFDEVEDSLPDSVCEFFMDH